MSGSAALGASKSTNQSSQQNTAQQNVYDQQAPYLQDLWGMAQNVATNNPYANNAASAAGQYAGQVTGDTYNPLVGSYNNAFGANNPFANASNQLTQPLVEGLTGIMNSPGETFGAGGSNPLLDKNVALALEQASTDLSRNILPEIGRDAQSAGQFGGSRQGVAEGLAAGEANKNALAAAMGAYGQQYEGDRSAQLASQQQADATRLGAGQQIADLMAGQGATVAQGVDTGQGLANLGMGQTNAYNQAVSSQFNPLQQYQNLINQPIVLGSASASGGSGGMSRGVGTSSAGGLK